MNVVMSLSLAATAIGLWVWIGGETLNLLSWIFGSNRRIKHGTLFKWFALPAFVFLTSTFISGMG